MRESNQAVRPHGVQPRRGRQAFLDFGEVSQLFACLLAIMGIGLSEMRILQLFNAGLQQRSCRMCVDWPHYRTVPGFLAFFIRLRTPDTGPEISLAEFINFLAGIIKRCTLAHPICRLQ